MSFIVKNTTLATPFDLLAPHSCRGCGHTGDILCKRCKKDIVLKHNNYCPNCKSLNPTGKCKKCKNLPPIFVVGERSNLIGELIHDFKYYSIRSLKNSLAEILNDILPYSNKKTIIIPLPTINKHIRERGMDHTYLLAKKLAKLRGKNYKVKKVILRNNNTVQVGADEKTRLIQAKHAYKINPKIPIDKETTYILLDDVWTTGASMKSALKKLRLSGARNIIIAILAVNRLD